MTDVPRSEQAPDDEIEISLDDVRKSAEAKASNLGRLGLSGLAEALDAYGITEPDQVARLVKILSTSAFRGIVNIIHPDRDETMTVDDEDPARGFETLYTAWQTINADPVKAVEQLILRPEEQAAAKRNSAAIENLNEVYELEKVLGRLRQEKIELLYKTSYSQLFGLEPGQTAVFDLIPYFINARDGRDSFLDPDRLIAFNSEAKATAYEDKMASYGQPTIKMSIKVTDGGLEMGTYEVTNNETAPPASIIKAFNSRVGPGIEANIREMQTAFDNGARIIGSVFINTSAGTDGPSPEDQLNRLHGEMVTNTLHSLPRGDVVDTSMLATIVFDPARTRWVDNVRGGIYLTEPGQRAWDFVVAKQTTEGMKIGLLGEYRQAAARPKATRKRSSK